MIEWETTLTALDNVILAYLAVSLLIEILDIVFFFTPTKEDDLLITKIKGFWLRVNKFFLALSVRTPVTLVLYFLVTFLSEIGLFIKNRFKRS